MSFWSSETLLERLPGLISPYRRDRIKHAAYELSLGTELILSPHGDRKMLGSGEQVIIPPGQFALLLTEEIVEVPASALALISMRFSVKQKGLVNVSGFHVDPGFRGRLKFSVYNAGVHGVSLTQGKSIFLIWYSDLDRITNDTYPKPPQLSLSDDDAQLLQGSYASPAELKQRLDELEKRFSTARTIGVSALLSLVIPLVIALLSAIFRMVVPSSLATEPPSAASVKITTGQSLPTQRPEDTTRVNQAQAAPSRR